MDSYNNLLRFLQINDFKVVILEGPSGVGKSYLCTKLLRDTNMDFYKGFNGYRDNHDASEDVCFILDLVTQIKLPRSLLVDKSFLSTFSLKSRYLFEYLEKEEYRRYVDLIRKSSALLLYLTSDIDTILNNKKINGFDISKHYTQQDIKFYSESIDQLCDNGLELVFSEDINKNTCYGLVAKELSDSISEVPLPFEEEILTTDELTM